MIATKKPAGIIEVSDFASSTETLETFVTNLPNHTHLIAAAGISDAEKIGLSKGRYILDIYSYFISAAGSSSKLIIAYPITETVHTYKKFISGTAANPGQWSAWIEC